MEKLILENNQKNYSSELKECMHYFNHEKENCFGIQMNQETADCIDFSPLLQHTLNNLGDPFLGKGTHLDTFKYERKLVRLMSNYLHLDSSSDAWGYYTSGSSISNLQAMYIAKNKLGDNTILITSEDAHNSITKAANITGIKEIILLKTNQKGEIDLHDFYNKLSQNKNKRITFFFTSGTVSKGAYDDVFQLVEIIKSFHIEDYYIHLDAALGGLITPFLKDKKYHYLDFSIPEINSITVSFHKRLGIPIPGSIFLLNKSKYDPYKNAKYVEDYSSFDITIPGSRDGFSPLVSYLKLIKVGHDEMVKRTNDVIKKATWFKSLLSLKGIEAYHNECSPCVYFEAPDQNLMKKYHLPLYKKNGVNFTHIFTMEHVKKDHLAALISKM